MKIGKFEIPPKIDKEITKENIKEKINSYIKNDYYITSDDFKKALNLILRDTDLFYKYSGELSTLMSVSIDEMNIINEENDDLNLDLQSDILKLRDSTTQKINNEIESYMGDLFFQYENASFPEKIKIISFLSTSYLKLFFNNNYRAQDRINNFFVNILEKEKEKTGNYYIFLHLDALKNKKEEKGYTQISPNQFITNKLTQDVDYQTQNLKNQTKDFISDPNDFEKIKALLRELDSIEKEYFKTNEEEINHFKKINDKEDEINKFFSTPLDELMFKLEKKNSDDNFLDHNFFLYKSVRQNFKERSGFSLEETSIPEQYYFFEYTKEITNKEADKFFNFLKLYGKSAFRTFLSIEQGGKEMGDKILALGEKLPKDIAQKVFEKYGEIIEIADSAENEIKKIYTRDNISGNILESISQKLLKKGAELLSDLSDQLDDLSEQEILNQLENIKTDTLIMGESYVELYKSGMKVPIEEIIGTTTERKNVKDLTEQQKKDIRDAYIQGRPESTYENSKHIKLLKEEFEAILNDEKTYLFNVIFNGKIIAFATYNEKDKDTLHIGGLTFIDDVRNSPFAVAVMNSMLKSFKDYNLEALVDSKNPILNMYIKRFGFEITGELPREENAGELYYEITKKKSPHTEKKEESLSMAA